MNPNKIKALLKRELTDILRDKKTLCMMVLLPLFLYPLMIVGMTLLFSAITQSQEETKGGFPVWGILLIVAGVVAVAAVVVFVVLKKKK